MNTKTRFAPSPTEFIHLGNTRSVFGRFVGLFIDPDTAESRIMRLFI